MATLTIRDLPEEIRSRLRVRAARNGRSMEAEARAILAGAVNAPAPENVGIAIEKLRSWIAQTGKKRPVRASSDMSVDAFLRERRRNAIREAIEDGYHPKDLFRGELGRILNEAGWSAAYVDRLVKQHSS